MNGFPSRFPPPRCRVRRGVSARHVRRAAALTFFIRSYEAGRSGYVTILANYEPFQDPQGGPNFYMLDPDVVYEINVDNNGDSRPDITFQFRFQNTAKNIAIPVGGQSVAVPVINVGGIGPTRHDTANLNVIERYSLHVLRGDGKGHGDPKGRARDPRQR